MTDYPHQMLFSPEMVKWVETHEHQNVLCIPKPERRKQPMQTLTKIADGFLMGIGVWLAWRLCEIVAHAL
jgi:hypothetical protein